MTTIDDHLQRLRDRIRRSEPRPEAGDTLIELLIVIPLLGLVAIAILLAFSTTIATSGQYRAATTLDTVLRSAAEETTSQMQQNGSSAFSCPSGYQVAFVLPTGYTAQISSMKYWSGTALTSSCTPSWAQLITLGVTFKGTTSNISFVVDDPFPRALPVSGPAAQLVFIGQPGSGIRGAAPTPSPVVAIEDAAGNVVRSDFSPVSLSVTAGTGTAGATLSNSCSGTEFAGVVTFSNCTMTTAGTNYTLTATDGNLTPGTSSRFTVTPGAATQLVFTTSPASGLGGAAFGAQPVVTVEDALGNPVTGDTSAVTLAMGSNPGGGALSCATNPVIAVGGVATFAGCNITKVGTKYTLTAADGGLTPAISLQFNVTPGPAAQLVFSIPPGSGTAGTALATQPAVTVQDAAGNTVTGDTSAVTLAMGSNPGGSTLTCTANPVTAVGGVATFAGCKIPKAGAGYTLTASDGTLSVATSSSFSIVAGTATQLVFTTSPGNGTFAAAFLIQPVVTVEDANGNPVTTSSASVTLATGTGTGALSCSANTVSAVAGTATFTGCKIASGTQGTFALKATSSGLIAGASAGFAVSPGPATRLVFTTQPGGGTGGVAWVTQPVVAVEDVGGNVVTGDTSAVTLIKGGVGVLTCAPNPVNAAGGVATFAGCSITKAGTGYTLSATDGSLTSATSGAFVVTTGPATQLVFTTSPVGAAHNAAFATEPVVAVADAGGNTVTSDTSNVTLAIGTNPGRGTLTCTSNPLAAAAGVAAFSSCKITIAGTGYTVTATDGSLTPGTSSTFNLS